MRTIKINYKELTESLTKLEEDYPSRMHGHIDLLRANFKYNLTQFLSGDILTVELDDSIRKAYINGKPIVGDVYAIFDTSKDLTSAEKIYEQILEAMKSAKQLGFYENVFHVREIFNSEDGSFLSKDGRKDNEYLDEVVMAVCIGGDCYSKYKQDVIRYFGDETNEKILRLLNELDVMHRWLDVGNKRLTETYKLSLKYLGKDIGLHCETIKDITDWQQKRLNHDGYDKLLLLVVATNSSMKELTSLQVTKEDLVENEIKDLISHFKGYKYDYWNNLTLSIITYDKFANNHTWPTHLQNIDEINLEIKATRENTVRISEGLKIAMEISQVFEGQTYMVLVSDGQDDDAEKTKKLIDTIKHKRSIEFYTYFVESLHSDTSHKEAFILTGGIPLYNPLERSVDWWVTRDVIPYSWYEQEGWYEQELGKVLGVSENEKRAFDVAEKTNNNEDNEEDDLWNRCHTQEDYQSYLKSYPFGKYSFEARRIIKLAGLKANLRKSLN